MAKLTRSLCDFGCPSKYCLPMMYAQCSILCASSFGVLSRRVVRRRRQVAVEALPPHDACVEQHWVCVQFRWLPRRAERSEAVRIHPVLHQSASRGARAVFRAVVLFFIVLVTAGCSSAVGAELIHCVRWQALASEGACFYSHVGIMHCRHAPVVLCARPYAARSSFCRLRLIELERHSSRLRL